MQYSSFETFLHMQFTRIVVIWQVGDDKGRADDRSVCFLYVLSQQIIQSHTLYQNVTQSNAYNVENNSCYSILTTGNEFLITAR